MQSSHAGLKFSETHTPVAVLIELLKQLADLFFASVDCAVLPRQSKDGPIQKKKQMKRAACTTVP
jgi:hypothetical protein